VHLLVGLQYDRKIWREMWPRVMSNTVQACKRAADFYGPGTRNGVPNLLVFEPLSATGQPGTVHANPDFREPARPPKSPGERRCRACALRGSALKVR
jgi:hypothetical protein